MRIRVSSPDHCLCSNKTQNMHSPFQRPPPPCGVYLIIHTHIAITSQTGRARVAAGSVVENPNFGVTTSAEVCDSSLQRRYVVTELEGGQTAPVHTHVLLSIWAQVKWQASQAPRPRLAFLWLLCNFCWSPQVGMGFAWTGFACTLLAVSVRPLRWRVCKTTSVACL
jgi:hypothetical protein